MQAEIYVVDDDPAVRQAIVKKLTRTYRVRGFERGETLLQAIEEKRPDLILVDLKMPDMNGLEILTKIKAKDRQARVVILTAYGSELDERIARGLGVQDFVTKAVDLANLEDVVRRALCSTKEAAGGSGR